MNQPHTACKNIKTNAFINAVSLIPVVYDIGQLLSASLHGDAIVEAAKGLLSDEKAPKRRKILTDLMQNLEDRSDLENRKDDEDWFKGTKFNGDSG